MASEDVPAFSQNLSGNGTASGSLPVTDSSGFYPGAYAWLSSDTASQYCQIVSLPDATHVQVRFLPDPGAPLAVGRAPSYAGGADASAFTTVLHARIAMFAQAVQVTQPTFSKRTQG